MLKYEPIVVKFSDIPVLPEVCFMLQAEALPAATDSKISAANTKEEKVSSSDDLSTLQKRRLQHQPTLPQVYSVKNLNTLLFQYPSIASFPPQAVDSYLINRRNTFNNLVTECDFKARPKDFLVIVVCDRNPIFNEENMVRLARWVNQAGFHYVHAVPMGTLQRHSIIIDMVMAGHLDVDKAKREGQCSETQTVNRLLYTFLIHESSFECVRWKPKNDWRDTPFPIKKDKIMGLKADLEQLLVKNNLPLEKVHGSLNLTALAKVANKEVRDRSGDLKNLLAINFRQEAVSIDSAQMQSTDFDLVDYIHKSLGKKRIEITQWAAIADADGALSSYIQAKRHFKILLKRKEKKLNAFGFFSVAKFNLKAFYALVDTLTLARMEFYYQKHAISEKKEDWLQRHTRKVKPYIEEYLCEEIPYFQMLVDNAVRLYTQQGCSTYLAYPWSGVNGRVVFDFVLSLNAAKLAHVPLAIILVNTKAVMLQENVSPKK